MLLAVCQHWKFWAFAEMLLMLLGIYWLPRQSQADSDGDTEQWSLSSKDENVEEEKEEKENDEDEELNEEE